MTVRPNEGMPCDPDLLEPLGRVNWAAARLHHVLRDRIGTLDGALSDDPFDGTLGSTVRSLDAKANAQGRADIEQWCQGVGMAAVEARNGVAHAIAFTAKDGKQALRGSTPSRPARYLVDDLLDVADQLIEAARALPS